MLMEVVIGYGIVLNPGLKLGSHCQFERSTVILKDDATNYGHNKRDFDAPECELVGELHDKDNIAKSSQQGCIFSLG